MVLASHSDELIRQMCNRAILLHHGRVIADGTPDQVIEQYHRLNIQADQQRTDAEDAAAAERARDPAGA
jgi:ABC-type polysaccharide/polyol phosphate transport system ATPase subunit